MSVHDAKGERAQQQRGKEGQLTVEPERCVRLKSTCCFQIMFIFGQSTNKNNTNVPDKGRFFLFFLEEMTSQIDENS